MKQVHCFTKNIRTLSGLYQDFIITKKKLMSKILLITNQYGKRDENLLYAYFNFN